MNEQDGVLMGLLKGATEHLFNSLSENGAVEDFAFSVTLVNGKYQMGIIDIDGQGTNGELVNKVFDEEMDEGALAVGAYHIRDTSLRNSIVARGISIGADGKVLQSVLVVELHDDSGEILFDSVVSHLPSIDPHAKLDPDVWGDLFG